MTPPTRTPLAAGPEIVAIPGPSVMPERVLDAMHRPMPDIYAGELTEVIDEVFDSLADDRRHDQPSLRPDRQRPRRLGDGAHEHAVAVATRCSCSTAAGSPRSGARWPSSTGSTSKRSRADRPRDRPDRPSRTAPRRRRHEIKAVLTVHVDTASSVRNDIPAIRRAIDAAGHPALFMVDCIASMGCEPFEMDDVGCRPHGRRQPEGLMTPPGLAIVWAGAAGARGPPDRRSRGPATGTGRTAPRRARTTSASVARRPSPTCSACVRRCG